MAEKCEHCEGSILHDGEYSWCSACAREPGPIPTTLAEPQPMRRVRRQRTRGDAVLLRLKSRLSEIEQEAATVSTKIDGLLTGIETKKAEMHELKLAIAQGERPLRGDL